MLDIVKYLAMQVMAWMTSKRIKIIFSTMLIMRTFAIFII